MRTVKVKICGITRDDDLQTAVTLGADALGFIVGVPASTRNLSLKQAEKLINQVPLFVTSVLVMVPQSVDDILQTCVHLRPDAVQLHGSILIDPVRLRTTLPNVSLIRALTTKSVTLPECASDASKGYDAVLLDSFAKGMSGGTGLIHDWNLSKRVKQTIHPMPLILAGGLTPENVQDAIHTVQPYAVDVSTGVESHPGSKDPAKVLAFIRNVKEFKVDDQ
jgi:phosphoribosylanthranilate isomerase